MMSKVEYCLDSSLSDTSSVNESPASSLAVVDYSIPGPSRFVDFVDTGLLKRQL